MTTRDILGYSFGAVMCLGVLLILIAGIGLLFGLASNSAMPMMATGFIVGGIGAIVCFLADPLTGL